MATARTRPLHDQRLGPPDITGWEFGRKFNGLDPDDVAEFQRLVAAEVGRLLQERSNAQRFPAAEVASREATRIMALSRDAGEKVIRQAQETARQVTVEARERRDKIIEAGHVRHEEIVGLAASQADAIVAEAAARFPADAQAQVAFLDSFAELLTTQLTSMVEVLNRRRPAAGQSSGSPAPGDSPATG